MQHIKDSELDARVNAFLTRKRAQFPELNDNTHKPSKQHGALLGYISTALLKPFHVSS